MKPRVALQIQSRMCQFLAATLLIPAAVGLFYGEGVGASYALSALAASATGFALRWGSGPTDAGSLSRREGFLAVVLAWTLMVLFGALPFWISGDFASLADAVFESASGYSTTGATILTDIEAMPRAHLFQRSLAHWVGGMGIIVLSVAILPELAVGGMQVFSAESPGISTDKLAPRIVSTARRLWTVYAGLTAVLAGLLLLGGMDLFDAVTHAFSTLSTGGFSPRNASIGAYGSLYIESVVTVFMLASGISFALHYRLLVRRQAGPLVRSAEVRLYLGIFVAFSAAIAAYLVHAGTAESVGAAVRDATFQTAAILTTTGFGTADFDRWPDFCRYMLVLLMFLGGCAGSTAGGVKVVRVLTVFKHATVELKKLLYPTIVHPVTFGNRPVSRNAVQGILGFFLLYIITTCVAAMMVLAMGVDLVTGVTAVISAMNSIGPGLGAVGPAGNYASMPDGCKWVLSVCMIVGRLEIYTVFVIFTFAFWRR